MGLIQPLTQSALVFHFCVSAMTSSKYVLVPNHVSWCVLVSTIVLGYNICNQIYNLLYNNYLTKITHINSFLNSRWPLLRRTIHINTPHTPPKKNEWELAYMCHEVMLNLRMDNQWKHHKSQSTSVLRKCQRFYGLLIWLCGWASSYLNIWTWVKGQGSFDGQASNFQHGTLSTIIWGFYIKTTRCREGFLPPWI